MFVEGVPVWIYVVGTSLMVIGIGLFFCILVGYIIRRYF